MTVFLQKNLKRVICFVLNSLLYANGIIIMYIWQYFRKKTWKGLFVLFFYRDICQSK